MGVRRRNAGVISCLIGFVLAFLLACGPKIHFFVSLLPLYDKLLWYRFITLVAIMWLMLAAYGATAFASMRGRYYPLNVLALSFALGVAVYILAGRATKIATASSRSQFDRSTVETAQWLREHGDHRGRVFSEFLNTNGIAAISVNYPRHMIPILSGFDEVAGWIYENNPATQGLMRKGPFWFDPLPMIEEAEHYNVKYIVAGSAQFVRALSVDPRWRLVHQTADLLLFERVAFEPSLAEGDGLAATVTNADYVRGGGYAYDIDVTQQKPSATLLVKTNDSPAWQITVDGAAVAHRATSDGLLLVDLPTSAATQRHVELRWSIEPWRRTGRRITFAALGVVVVLLGLGSRKRSRWRLPLRPIQIAGTGASAVMAIVVIARARPLDASIGGYGVAGGMEIVRPLDMLEVGAYDDDQPTRPNHVLAAAWSERHTTSDGQTARTLQRDEPAALITLSRHNTLVVQLAPQDGTRELRVTLSREGTSSAACELTMRSGQPARLPDACASGDDGATMGHRRLVTFSDAVGIDIHSIAVDSDTHYVEAESLENTVHDGGCEAYYGMSPTGAYDPSNGVLMTTAPPATCPVDMTGRVALAPGTYDVWVLERAFHPRYGMTRGKLTVVLNGDEVGTFDGTTAHDEQFWDSQGRFEWFRLGEVTSAGGELPLVVEFRRKRNAVGSAIDLDALAFVARP
jgi:hypothetical protein